MGCCCVHVCHVLSHEAMFGSYVRARSDDAMDLFIIAARLCNAHESVESRVVDTQHAHCFLLAVLLIFALGWGVDGDIDGCLGLGLL